MCDSYVHKDSLEDIWNNFVHTVNTEAKRIFGVKVGRDRVIPGWNEWVSEHYAASREAFLAWRMDNSPRQGRTADHMRRCRARFKLALRQCKAREKEARALALSRKFDEKRMSDFWADIKSLNSSRPKLSSVVDGVSGNRDICQLWGNKFEAILNSIQDTDCAEELSLRLQGMADTPVSFISPGEISLIASAMGSGKSPGTDNIPVEFYKQATPGILSWLCHFLNALLIHEYIPKSITEVVISPLLKSSLKDPCISSNYRPIAHATCISKILENVILNRLEDFLGSTDFQFGFKKGHGTDTCIFALKDMINYYKNLSTPVFLCFLDIKSCFDMISYNKLFIKLADRGAPKYIIKLLLQWYSGQNLRVRWGNAISEAFGMKNGIRQGSCLSPKLFPIYVDELNTRLRDSRIGCHVAGVCMNNFSYADDMVLASPDAKSLNKMLDICHNFARENFITYSISKTEAMVIKPRGMRDLVPPKITINGDEIGYVEKFKYLGHIITSDFTDDADIEREIRNLYIRGNTIIRKFGFLSIEVKLSLFKAYCYCLYTCSLWSKYRVSSMNKMRVAYNNIFRKLLRVPQWHSARTLFVNLGVRSFYETIRTTSYSLMQRVICCQNSLIQVLLQSDAFVVSATRKKWYSNLYTAGHFNLFGD